MAEKLIKLGLLLALADNLHLQYCKFQEGHLPEQPLGSRLFGVALDQPAKALAQVKEQLVPYQQWGQAFQKEDSAQDVSRIRRWLGQIADTVALLDDQPFPVRLSNLERAKVLSGYLVPL